MIKLTVAEYAEFKGTSLQAIYKKIDRLNTVEEERNGRKQKFILLSNDEEKLFNNINDNSTANQPISTPIQQEYNGDTAPNSTPIQQEFNDNTTPIQQEIIAILREELAEKNRQIKALQEQYNTQAETHKKEIEELHRLLDQEQQLHAASIKYLPAAQDIPEEEAEEEPKKRNIIDWILKRKSGS